MKGALRGLLAAAVWLGGLQTAPALACASFAARHYGVPEVLLHALARQESGGRANALNHNTNGTRDIGLM